MACSLGAIVATASAVRATTIRVSVSSGGAEPNQNSSDSAISADGRFVAFRSGASNLVREDGNDAWDIFVRDLKSGRISRASVSSTGAEANGSSGLPAISADGRFVAFVAEASNLVSGDQNNTDDVFVRDLKTRGTRRVSISSSGAEGNGRSLGPQISADGRFVAFLSRASNLVSGDRNDVLDVFVRDLKTRRTTRVSVSSGGGEGNGPSAIAVMSISADVVFVALDS